MLGDKKDFVVILFYKYVDIADPEGLAKDQQNLCKRLNLKGRLLIAREGVNGTLEGERDQIDEYCREFKKIPLFADVVFKESAGTGKAFPKLMVKVRDEIVASGFGGLKSVEGRATGKYLSPEELKEWIKSGKKFHIVDMRNDYEQKGGHFKNSILSNIRNFRYLPEFLPKIKHLSKEKVVTVCTGGVRCEKASGYLIENGFQDVYQLEGGMHKYMEKYPNEDFKGKLYVFDGRILVGFNTEDPKHEVIGRCDKCGAKSENYVNCGYDECHRHYICCEKCVGRSGSFCGYVCAALNNRFVRFLGLARLLR